jgi:tagatose-6-phosphate ketose/aldose isomerase
VVTCNRSGRVASAFQSHQNGEPRIRVITLDDRTCDRSLVMTSSFTCMAVAGLGLAYTDQPERYLDHASRLAALGRVLLADWADRLAGAAVGGFQRMLILGDGCCFGAARETALKMLEMTGGRVMTMAETTLGFRHGPMCALRDGAMLVMLLSSDPLRRAYQVDLLGELRAKRLGERRIVVGGGVPPELLDERDLAVDLPGLGEMPDHWAAIFQVVVGQLLAFFRCRAESLHPDQPAAGGAISQVVGEFPLHGALAKFRL